MAKRRRRRKNNDVIPVGRADDNKPDKSEEGYGLITVGGTWVRVPKSHPEYKRQKELGIAKDL